jgi:glycosyltransferase involved in cell wall biosynthesis
MGNANSIDLSGRSATLDSTELSIVLPAKNEAAGLRQILPVLRDMYPAAEIIVVDSGSTDATADVARENGANVVAQPYSYGNGAAVKAGIRHASKDHVVLMDADGQHDPADIPRLLEKYGEGYDMVVGARESDTQATTGRRIANYFYSKFASWMVNRRIDDLTSGFRVVRAGYTREFLHLFPNGFSYPATITMAFFRSGFSVAYVPVRAKSREGKSHINPVGDGLRFLLIIFRIGTLYSPLKVFTPISAAFFLMGVSNYMYTYWTTSRLTNMTVLLISSSVLFFMIGLLSEQITNLYYGIRNHNKSNPDDDVKTRHEHL